MPENQPGSAEKDAPRACDPEESVRALVEDESRWWYDEDDNPMIPVSDLRAALAAHVLPPGEGKP